MAMPGTLPLLAAAFAAGVWAAGLASVPAAVLGALAAALFAAGLVMVRREARSVAAVAAALFFVAGMIRCGHATVADPYDVSRFAGQTVVVHGTVADLPRWEDVDHETVRVRYVVAANAAEAGGVRLPAKGGVAVSLRQPHTAPVAAYGDKVAVRGRMAALHGYNNPGQADMVAAYRLAGVTARLAAGAEDFRAAPGESRSAAAALAAWRQKMTGLIRATMAPGDAAVVNGVLFGGYAG